MDLNRTQKKLDSYKLGVKFSKDIDIKTLGDIIYNAIQLRLPTFYTNGKIQCMSGRHRSAEDIYRIAKNYKLTITLKEVIATLSYLTNYTIGSHYCPDVRKRVYYFKSPISSKVSYNTLLTIKDLNITL